MFRTEMVALCAAGTIASLSASAQTFSLRYTGPDQGRELRVIHPDMRGGNFTGYVGSFTFDATPLAGGDTTNFLTYCLTPSQRIETNQGISNEYELVSVFDERVLNGDDAATATVRSDAIAAVTAAAAGMQVNPSENFAIAFQLIVWEILLDYDQNVGLSSIDLTGGDLRSFEADLSPLDSEIGTFFDALKTSVGASPGAGGLQPLAFHNDTLQDQLVFVPAPSGAALLAIGGLAAARRRR